MAAGDRTDLVEELERRLLPSLRDLAAELGRELPRCQFQVYSLPVGSLTDFQGHALGLDCLIRDAPASGPDNLVLEVILRHLTTTPALEADVCWGHPSAHLEAELSPAPLIVTEETLAHLEAALPHLAAALRAALYRGQPPTD